MTQQWSTICSNTYFTWRIEPCRIIGLERTWKISSSTICLEQENFKSSQMAVQLFENCQWCGTHFFNKSPLCCSVVVKMSSLVWVLDLSLCKASNLFLSYPHVLCRINTQFLPYNSPSSIGKLTSYVPLSILSHYY